MSGKGETLVARESAGTSGGRGRVSALMAFYNEMRYLPGWFENVRGRVDAVVLLDDGSTDGGGDYASAQAEATVLLRNDPRAKTGWDEPGNRRKLITAGQELGADWFLTIDADERVEDAFWDDLDALLRWAGESGTDAFKFRLREMWDSTTAYRADGIWGRKTKLAFFRNAGAAHDYDDSAWHGEWVPMHYMREGRCREVPYDLFHLKMIHEADRIARRDRYKALDPGNKYQPIGYDYLTDDRGILITPLASGQSYRGMPPA